MRIVGPIKFWRVCVIYLEKKKKMGGWCVHASARPHDGSTRGRWMLCTHPPFLGLHMCNKMGSTPVLQHKIRQNQHKKKLFFTRRFLTTFQKNCSILRPLLSRTFPQGFRICKKFGHPTSGSGGKHMHKCHYAKRGHTNIPRTSRLLDRIGPVGRFDEKYW